MSEKASLLLEDDILQAIHEFFKPFDQVNPISTPADGIYAIKDPRASSTMSPHPLPLSEQLRSHEEQPKAAISYRRKDAIIRSLIHIPAFVMTLGTLSLSFRGQDGVPLSLLSSGLQYSSLEILMRKDFRNVVASLSRVRRYLRLVSLVVLTFFLASTSGPSAAIAILPRLEWWPVRPSDGNPLPVIYLNSPTGPTFPAVVTYPQTPCNYTDYNNDDPCRLFLKCASDTTTYYWCPSGGLSPILKSEMMQSLLAGDLVLSPAQILISSYDIILGDLSTFSRSINGNLLRETSGETTSTLFVASVVTDIVAITLGNFWEQQNQTNSLARPMVKTSSGEDQITGLQKPIVQVQCTGSYHIMTNSTPDMISFPTKYHIPAHQSWTFPLANILTNSTFDDSENGPVTFKWVDLEIPDSPSAAAIFLVPRAMYTDSAPNLPSSYHNIFACTLDAIWIPSESWIDPTTDDVIHEAISNPLEERHHFKDSRGKIQLSGNWLDAINVVTDATDAYETAFQSIASSCIHSGNPYSNYTVMDVCLESVVALFVADGLARMQSTTDQFWLWNGQEESIASGESHLANTSYSTPKEVAASLQSFFNINITQDPIPRFTLEIMQYGYGYGFRGSNGIYIATVILLTYVLITLIHVAVMIIGGWSSDTWSTPGELIALAINSSQSKLLQNTCVGIENSEMWNQIVSVRETLEAHLEIVFDEEAKSRADEETPHNKQSIELQESQPHTDKLGSRVRKRVTPGKKYGAIE